MNKELPIIGFCAQSGTGKTTLIKNLIPLLKQQGIRVAVIKHTHHVIDLDKPGKDSYEIREAGAKQVVLASHKRIISTSELVEDTLQDSSTGNTNKEASLDDAIEIVSNKNIDAILVEGFKHESYPKIEVHREELGKPLLYPEDSQIFAVISDNQALQLPNSLHLLNLNNLEQVTDFLTNRIKQITNSDKKLSPSSPKASNAEAIPLNNQSSIRSDTTIRSAPSCADNFDPNSLTYDAALDRILSSIEPVALKIQLPLRSALGRVLASDIISPINVPNHTNSAMDGYALRGDDLPENEVREYKIVGTAMAGKPSDQLCNKNECIRIMTGATMPEYTDTVIMQEQTEVEPNGLVRIGTGHRAGQNVRQAGEDIKTGSIVLQKGRKLTPADIGIISSLGIGEVETYRSLRVAFFSTGDELCSIGETLKHGQVFDSNRYTLHSLLTKLDIQCLDLGVVKDNPDALERTLNDASKHADVIITSGGVSVGEADYIKTVLDKLGKINFWKIAIKPGRPLAYGQLGDALFFGLPGNPVAVMITFLQMVQPALLKLSGQKDIKPLIVNAICQSKLKKKPGRTEFQRGIVSQNENGILVVEKSGHQGSGILTSMSMANCLIILSQDSKTVMPGDSVQIQLL